MATTERVYTVDEVREMLAGIVKSLRSTDAGGFDHLRGMQDMRYAMMARMRRHWLSDNGYAKDEWEIAQETGKSGTYLDGWSTCPKHPPIERHRVYLTNGTGYCSCCGTRYQLIERFQMIVQVKEQEQEPAQTISRRKD